MIEAQYVLLGIAMAAAVGPVCIETVRRGLKHGFHYAFPVALGTAVADSTYILLVYFGLSGFLSDPRINSAMWVIGSLVLFFLSYKSFIGFKEGNHFRGSIRRRNSFLTGFMIAITSPITIIWWLGIFGALVARLPREAALLNGFAIVAGGLAWFFSLSLLLHWGRRWIDEDRLRYVSLVAGIALSLFAAYFFYREL
jgi:threonine/homoserine/homoserine lactone efflux protein